MWRQTTVVNFKVDEADQSPLGNTSSALIKKLPNKLVPQVPYWAYTLHSQLGYSQAGDGVPVQGATYHVVAAIEVPARDTRVAELQLSYQFEDSESDSEESTEHEGGRTRRKLSDNDLQHYITKKLRDYVMEECPKDGIVYQDVENFELGYLRFLYQQNRTSDVDQLCKNVAHEPIFKGQVHPVRRYLTDLCYQVQRAISMEKNQENKLQYETQFLTAFYKANQGILMNMPAIQGLPVEEQKAKLAEMMRPDQYYLLEKRLNDYVSQQLNGK